MNELSQLQVNEYQIEVIGESPVTIQRRLQYGYGSSIPDKWAVMRLGDSMSKCGEWECSPSPSNMDGDFINRCRFDTPEEALACYQQHRQSFIDGVWKWIIEREKAWKEQHHERTS